MAVDPLEFLDQSPAVEAHLCGRLDFDRCQSLQHRLVQQVADRQDGQIYLLLCEHPDLITIGRGGSPADVQLDSGRIHSGQLPVRWVKRGGGCLVHAPGQIAVYPIVPLRWHRLSVGEYLARLQTAIQRALQVLDISTETRPGRYGLWGRTGQVVAIGVAVRDWIAYHGAFINVNPPMGLFRLVTADRRDLTPMSCLVAERQRPVKMTSVRAEVIRELTEALGCDRYHMYTGHPLLRIGEGREKDAE
jgi:lipoyl(octanoyl) transferase